MSGKKTINFCLVGAGRMGRRWAKIVNDNPQTRLAVIVDKDLSSAKKMAEEFNAVYSDNFKTACLENSAIQAVLVVTPHKFLFPYSLASLKAGKHVLVEKPGSCTAQQMQRLVRLAQKNNKILMVGFNYRFFDSIRRLKKIVTDGRIGEVNFLRIKHGHGGRPGYNREWRMNSILAGGGALMDQGVHVLDLANWFLPSAVIESVGMGNNKFWHTQAEENAFILLKTKEGETASLHVSVVQWKPVFVLEIFGSLGYGLINGLGRKYGGSEVLTIGLRKKDGTVKEKEIICNPDADNSLKLELGEFVKSMQKQKIISSNGLDALKVLKLAGKFYNQSL